MTNQIETTNGAVMAGDNVDLIETYGRLQTPDFGVYDDTARALFAVGLMLQHELQKLTRKVDGIGASVSASEGGW